MPGLGVIVTERGVGLHSGLPAEVSSLVGRGPQLAAVLDGLRAARAVTLTGPGGCGKTRLALRAATLAGGGFEDGARLVELASLTDAALRYAEGVMAWHRGDLGDAEHLVREAPATAGTSSATTASPRRGTRARDSPSTTRWPMPPARAAAANAPPPAGPA
jgi:hypothetical protein